MKAIILMTVIWSPTLNTGIDRIFTHTSTPTRTSGLILQIASTKQTHFVWQPVNLVCRIRNITDQDSIVLLDPNSLTLAIPGRYPNTSRRMVQSVPSGSWIVPAGKEVYFVVGLSTFTIGKTSIFLQYAPTNQLHSREFAGVAVFEDVTQSNELEIEVVSTDPRTSEEKRQVDNIVRQYMAKAILHGEQGDKAYHVLINMGRYAIPTILKELQENPNEEMRDEILDILRLIGLREDSNSPEGHRPMDDAFIETFVEAYEKENSVDIKDDYLWVMTRYKRASPEKRALIIKTFKETLNNQTSPSLRSEATSALLQFSKIDGLHEVLDKIDRLEAPDFFGEQGLKDVLYILGGIMRSEWERNNPSKPYTMEILADLHPDWQNKPVKQLRAWWKENKDRLEAEAKQPEVDTSQGENNRKFEMTLPDNSGGR